jgi:hypothetical protein
MDVLKRASCRAADLPGFVRSGRQVADAEGRRSCSLGAFELRLRQSLQKLLLGFSRSRFACQLKTPART